MIEARIKISRADGSTAYGETLKERIERLNQMAVERVSQLENALSISNDATVSAFREKLIDDELQKFFFNELLPEAGKVRFFGVEEWQEKST